MGSHPHFSSVPVSPRSVTVRKLLFGESDEEYFTALKTKPKICVRFNEEVTIKRLHKSHTIYSELTVSQKLEPSSGAFERFFGPVHPNGAPRRRRHSLDARKLYDTATAQPDVEIPIYAAVNSACSSFRLSL